MSDENSTHKETTMDKATHETLKLKEARVFLVDARELALAKDRIKIDERIEEVERLLAN